MTAPSSQRVLVVTPFLIDRRTKWADGFELIAPADLSDELAQTIEVIATGGSLDAELVDRLPNLKLVACFSTGYEAIDLAQLRAREITLTTASGINAHDVADHAIALMLGHWHGLIGADATVRSGRWREGLTPRRSLKGKRVGVVGLGRIGLAIARRAEALGMDVSWWGPRPKADAPYPRTSSLAELAAQSDVLILASRAVPENRHQIDAAIIEQLGSDGLLVNVSRGFLVDEVALRLALSEGRLGGAALDVFDPEPAKPAEWDGCGRVLLTPHLAGYTQEAGEDMIWQLGENIRRYFAGVRLLSPV